MESSLIQSKNFFIFCSDESVESMPNVPKLANIARYGTRVLLNHSAQSAFIVCLYHSIFLFLKYLRTPPADNKSSTLV
jgi:hypothetical protein